MNAIVMVTATTTVVTTTRGNDHRGAPPDVAQLSVEEGVATYRLQDDEPPRWIAVAAGRWRLSPCKQTPIVKN